MKLKPLLIAVPLTVLASGAFAAGPADSVGVQSLNGKKVILHKTDPKDNYYSIARRYNVRPAAIMQLNNNLALHIGDTVKVPTEIPYSQPNVQPPVKRVQTPVYSNNPPAGTPSVNTPQNVQAAHTNAPGTQEYKVSAGETLYAVSRRFTTTVDNLVSLNNLKSTNLSPGQILLVPNGSAPPPAQQQPAQQPVVQNTQPVTAVRDSTSVAAADSSAANRRLPANRYGIFEKNEKGIATWMDDTGLDAKKNLVLHRTAPIGTVIKITNPMTSRTTFAKVVGRFNDNESTKDVLIVMTKNAAESLGALDKRFRVNISYGIPE